MTSWEQIAHELAGRIFLGYCGPDHNTPDCPGCADREALKSYKNKCKQMGVRYSGQTIDELVATSRMVPIHELKKDRHEKSTGC